MNNNPTIVLPSGVQNIDFEIVQRDNFFYFELVHSSTGQRRGVTGDLGSWVYQQARQYNDVLCSAPVAR